jgi:hypothetical protein
MFFAAEVGSSNGPFGDTNKIWAGLEGSAHIKTKILLSFRNYFRIIMIMIIITEVINDV